MAMEDLDIIMATLEFIKDFFSGMHSYIDDLLDPIFGWIDHVDQAFLGLFCFVDMPAGHTSRIWRALTNHWRFHPGLNTMMSIRNVVNLNLIEEIIEFVLRTAFNGLRQEFLSVIGTYGDENEAPDEDDEDDWLPRYWIEGTPGTTLTQLRVAEAAIGQPIGGVDDSDKDGPWVAAAASGGSLLPSCLVDLNPQQAIMASIALPNFKFNQRVSWGQGTWTFILDAGFTTSQYEGSGQDLGDREIRIYVVPNQYTLSKYHPTPNQVLAGTREADETIEDNLYDSTGKSFGVTSKANLYFIKIANGAALNSLMPTSITRKFNTREAFARAMEHVYEQLTTGGIPPTKSVIHISQRFGFDDVDTDQAWRQTCDEWVSKLDALGVTTVASSGDGGFDPATKGVKFWADKIAPGAWISDRSSTILVGGLYSDGSLWEGSSPARGNTAISLYAQATPMSAFISEGRQVKSADDLYGCSLAASQVSGLVAYLLGYPGPAGQNPFDPANTATSGPVGRRMKDYLTRASYQRLPDKYLSEEAQGVLGNNLTETSDAVLGSNGFPYIPPSGVNVIYNMAEGDQRCASPPGFPVAAEAKRDIDDGSCSVRKAGPGTVSMTTGYLTESGYATTMTSKTSAGSVVVSVATLGPHPSGSVAGSGPGPSVSSSSSTSSKSIATVVVTVRGNFGGWLPPGTLLLNGTMLDMSYWIDELTQ
ncbi:hypothetical protein B0H66DRAFT_600872 [Apodospora peruviana]|uniref:Uncharacterized protein n=1 Tax=Apodospora peruviana TaxID=516989 RepID=A0AAE0MC45_9PEZI|nr:hypothetical protein B0H66DRAFT_600872 [Apodospora peruviana]